jgi:hypothetical protein
MTIFRYRGCWGRGYGEVAPRPGPDGRLLETKRRKDAEAGPSNAGWAVAAEEEEGGKESVVLI